MRASGPKLLQIASTQQPASWTITATQGVLYIGCTDASARGKYPSRAKA
jgi:hypothetical protein